MKNWIADQTDFIKKLFTRDNIIVEIKRGEDFPVKLKALIILTSNTAYS